MFMIMS